MELGIFEQIFELIKKSGRVLIALPRHLNVDALASGLALKLFLLKQKKEVEIVCSSPVPDALKFLPGSELVMSSVSSAKSLVIHVDTSVKKLEEISYETENDKTSIFIKAKESQFSPEDVTFAKEKAPFDLVFVLDASSLSAVGKVFEDNPDVFYETPKVNVDHKAQNEFFGVVNLVDLTATSTGEILAALMEKYEQQLIDEDVATCLLAGIIAKTDSFQHAKTTPRAFLTASQLIALGGRQQEIVSALYKTKPLNFLRLWGRTLAKLKGNGGPAIYAVLSQTDFEKSAAGAEFLPDVLKDLLNTISGKQMVAVAAEAAGGSDIYAAILENIDPGIFAVSFGAPMSSISLTPHNFKLLKFALPQLSIAEAENRLLEIAKKL